MSIDAIPAPGARGLSEGGRISSSKRDLPRESDTNCPQNLYHLEQDGATFKDRRIAEKRTFPAFNINRSGTRKEELITDPSELAKMWILRKLLHPMDELAAIEFLLDKMKDTKTNAEFFAAMKR